MIDVENDKYNTSVPTKDSLCYQSVTVAFLNRKISSFV